MTQTRVNNQKLNSLQNIREYFFASSPKQSDDVEKFLSQPINHTIFIQIFLFAIYKR